MPVFISHSNQDRTFYTLVCSLLDRENIPRWDEQKLVAGHSLADQLRNAIEKCDVCIFLATRNSKSSPWCLAELGAFWGVGKKVIIYHDSSLSDLELPKQFEGNVWAHDSDQLIPSVRALTDKQATESIDLFLAAPMAAYNNDEEYQAARAEVIKVQHAFKEHCHFNVYCALENCPTKKAFETADVSIKEDLRAIRNARYFVMLYPQKMASSVLFEAGFALALDKYSLYFAADRTELPFMLREAAGVFGRVRIHEVPCLKNNDCIVDVIRINQHKLFDHS